MVFKKRSHVLVVVPVLALVLLSGCSGPVVRGPGVSPVPGSNKAVVLARKFSVGDKATYVATTESSRAVEFEGTISQEADLKGGVARTKVELTFTEQIESVGDAGIAKAKITILKAKYLRELAKRGIVADYDSSKGNGGPLAKLVGQSYRIEMTPSGEVTKVLDAEAGRSAVRRSKIAVGLLKTSVIKERHSIAALPAAGKNLRRIGDNWSNVKSTDFGMMGKKAYERIYVLKELTKVDGRTVAVVEMNAIPTADSPNQASGDAESPFTKMFDNIDKYTGLLKLDLTTGKVDEYFEKLKTQWIVVDPMPTEKNKDKPDMLKMTGIMDQRLERID